MSIALFHHAGLAIASYAQDFHQRHAEWCTHVSGIGGHDSEVVLVDDLLHLLHATKISQHVADGNDVSVLDQSLSDVLGRLDSAGTDRLLSAELAERAYLLDEVGGLGEKLDQVKFKISALGRASSVRWRASNDDSATVSA